MTCRLNASPVVCALALLVGPAASRAVAASAELYRLAPPTSYDSPNGVSPDGSLVLTTEHVWTPAGGLVRFAPAEQTYSRDISNTGVVVGLTDGDYNPFRSPIGGPVQRLNTGYGDAFGITPDGSVVVGYANFSDTGFDYQAARWTAGGGPQGLGRLPNPSNDGSDVAMGVSHDGTVIVGRAFTTAGAEAFRWTAATGMVSLGDLDGGEVNGSALAVSGDGRVIVGYAGGEAGQEAFRWTQQTGMVGLGDLDGGNFYSVAEAVSADGSVVVGRASPASGGSAFIWTAADGMRSLQEVLVTDYGVDPAKLAGLTLAEATDVSDDGRVIVGYGYNASGDSEGFVVVIPEPAAGVLAVGFASFALTRRRGRSGRSRRQ